MDRCIVSAKNISGGLRLPGDKSISHRYAILAAIAEGETVIRNYAPGADCASTLRCLEALGVRISRRQLKSETGEAVEELVLGGRGLYGLQAPAEMLDAGNSGSTIRMLSGVLAGHHFTSTISGDESLERRPMKRIISPLEKMGAKITARDGNYPPLRIEGRRLRGIDYEMPVPSAQVKSSVLLAGLLAEGETHVSETVQTRDHTEIALVQFGAEVTRKRKSTLVRGGRALQATQVTVPGDISSAAFFVCAALMFLGSDLYLQDVGLNPTRTALLDFLCGMGADLQILNLGEATPGQGASELIGDIHVHGGTLRGGRIEGEMVAALIDEIPILAILGTQTEEGLVLSNAEELRVKESDRIATVADNLQRMGVAVNVRPDGMDIPGRQQLKGAALDSFGDHRIAMAFSVAALVAQGDSLLHNSDAAVVSFPDFYERLEKITEK